MNIQYMVYGVLGLIVLTWVFPAILNPFKTMFTKTNTPTNNHEIYEIVEQWEKLRKMLEVNGLEDSLKQLDQVFLRFLNKGNKDE